MICLCCFDDNDCKKIIYLFIKFFLKIPAQFASSKTAEEMALLAYNRALKLSKPGSFYHGFLFLSLKIFSKFVALSLRLFARK